MIEALLPDARLLWGAVILDFLLGDPVYAAHPVRLMGRKLTWFEARLRRAGWDGYAGGIALFVLMALVWVGGTGLLLIAANRVHPWLAMAIHLVLVYSLLALRDLLRHAAAVDAAAARGDLESARAAVSQLVGRDTNRMDAAACRRAAIESMSESLTDGFLSPLFWYALAGVPGIVTFKVVSTMDSMVGFKTPPYLYFGWCGARLDDAMNLLPARMAWLLIAGVAAPFRGLSAQKALRIGWEQHAIVPGPNSGWSEAATAGAIERRLIGPIWAGGKRVTSVWLGDPDDPEAGTSEDLRRAAMLITLTALAAALATVCLLVAMY